MCVNTDKKINMIQTREPIKFEDITSLEKLFELEKPYIKE
jgi:hypothetical protein